MRPKWFLWRRGGGEWPGSRPTTGLGHGRPRRGAHMRLPGFSHPCPHHTELWQQCDGSQSHRTACGCGAPMPHRERRAWLCPTFMETAYWTPLPRLLTHAPSTSHRRGKASAAISFLTLETNTLQDFTLWPTAPPPALSLRSPRTARNLSPKCRFTGLESKVQRPRVRQLTAAAESWASDSQ